MKEKFIVAISQKDNENAIKEIALAIKYKFQKPVKTVLVLFTPQYLPQILTETLALTLHPQNILGLQSPFLIYEDQILDKAVICCCIVDDNVNLVGFFIKESESEKIEAKLRNATKQFIHKQFILPFITQKFNINSSIRSFELAIGKMSNVFGGGYIRRYGFRNYQIVNNTIEEEILCIFGSGIKITTCKINGFVPVGRPFLISKILDDYNVIKKISNDSPVKIYQNYLAEKFEVFKQKHLFTLYPLIIDNITPYLVSVIECLDDGSLVCIGNLKENVYANLSIFSPETMFKEINEKITKIDIAESGLLFIINSLVRKKILKNYALQEIVNIKNLLNKNFKIVGIFSDYVIFPDYTAKSITTEAATNFLMFWE